jgi:4-amino-4-deoxy-L-arabinose transferase-like glycosyltransferase
MTGGRRWSLVFCLAFIVIVATHIAGLASSPPGLHTDEASIGYNAWTIAHYGTDQFGTAWPLLFRDFGDYKGPISTYLLAPLTLLSPLTPTLTRLPSAFAGIVLAVAAALLAWRITRSRGVALIVMLEAAFEPWFFHTARINLEADLFTVLCFVVALAAIAAGGVQRKRNCLVAGIAIGLAPFAAQPGRFFAVVFVVLLVFTHARLMRRTQLCLLVLPVVLATLLLVLGTDGNAVARLGGVSVTQHGVLSGIASLAGNYLQYFNPDFLFLHGDPNPRHSSGFGGLLLLTAVPVLAVGLVTCVRRWREPMCRLALAGLVVAPLGPAVTTGISARRDVVFLPFLLLLFTYGWAAVVPVLGGHRLRVAAASGLVAVAAGLYLTDYVVAYPSRAVHAFDTGVVPALVAAHAAAGSHLIFVSSTVPDLDEEALFALQPPPGAPSVERQLRLVVVTGAAQLAAAQPGDVAVLTAELPAPPGFALIEEESVTGPTQLFGPTQRVPLVDVYVRR